MRKRIPIHEEGEYLADAVFAASDGLVTTFAVVAGSIGASLSNNVVLIMGFANLFADGLSMAAGKYIGIKSEIEFEEVKGQDGKKEGPPLTHGIITFIAFNISGLVPLIPFIFKMESAPMASTVFVGLAMFLVGMARSFYTKRGLFRSGVEMFTVGGIAAFVAFAVGFVLNNYVL